MLLSVLNRRSIWTLEEHIPNLWPQSDDSLRSPLLAANTSDWRRLTVTYSAVANDERITRIITIDVLIVIYLPNILPAIFDRFVTGSDLRNSTEEKHLNLALSKITHESPLKNTTIVLRLLKKVTQNLILPLER